MDDRRYPDRNRDLGAGVKSLMGLGLTKKLYDALPLIETYLDQVERGQRVWNVEKAQRFLAASEKHLENIRTVRRMSGLPELEVLERRVEVIVGRVEELGFLVYRRTLAS